MRRFLIILLLVIVAGTIALSFYQPPMRLMPTPTVFLDGAANAFAANPNLEKDNRIEIFYATNRLAVGPRSRRTYAVVPGRDLQLGVATLRMGKPRRRGKTSMRCRRTPSMINGRGSTWKRWRNSAR